MPFTDGTLCTKVAHYLERTYSPDRLLYPMRRVGKKGEGKFERITWDEALDEIAARLKALAAENPRDHPALQLRRHDGHGAVQLDGPALLPQPRRVAARPHDLLVPPASSACKATLGGSVGMDPERFDEAKLIILWGANPIVSNLHLWSRVQEAKRRGAKVVAIDPVSQPVGGEVHAARRAAAGHRRRARARHDARADRART